MDESLEPGLIVSFTSHPARFEFLSRFLRDLSTQSDCSCILVLNIFEKDRDKLPAEIFQLDLPYRLQVHFTEDDWGPAKKLIPTAKLYPNSHILTLDDDIEYPNNLIEMMKLEIFKNPQDVLANRVDLPNFSKNILRNYGDWAWDVDQPFNHLVVPIGVGGVIYPPRSLHQDAFNFADYRNLSWSTDDIWFWVHSIRNGVRVRKSDYSFKTSDFEYEETKRHGLSGHGNLEILNDINLQLLWRKYEVESILDQYLQFHNQKIYQGPSAENLNGEILKATNFLRSQDLMSILEAIDGHQRLILIRHFMRLISKINQSERVRATLLGNVIDFKNNIERKIVARSING